MSTDSHRTTDAVRDDILVVLEPGNPEPTVRAAIENTESANATYHLLMVVPTRSYEARRRAFADAGVPVDYTIGKAKEGARQTAQRIGREYFGRETGFEATGTVGRQREHIEAAVDNREFETIYVPEPDRSFLQRLLGGRSRANRIASDVPESTTVKSVDVAGEHGDGAGYDVAFAAGGAIDSSD